MLYFYADENGKITSFIEMTDPQISFRVPEALENLLALPLFIVILAIGLVAFTILAWRRCRWKLIERFYYTLFTITALIFIWWLNNWNLLLYVLQYD